MNIRDIINENEIKNENEYEYENISYSGYDYTEADSFLNFSDDDNIDIKKRKREKNEILHVDTNNLTEMHLSLNNQKNTWQEQRNQQLLEEETINILLTRIKKLIEINRSIQEENKSLKAEIKSLKEEIKKQGQRNQKLFMDKVAVDLLQAKIKKLIYENQSLNERNKLLSEENRIQGQRNQQLLKEKKALENSDDKARIQFLETTLEGMKKLMLASNNANQQPNRFNRMWNAASSTTSVNDNKTVTECTITTTCPKI